MVAPLGVDGAGAPNGGPASRSRPSDRLLLLARDYDRKGNLTEAADAYGAAARSAEVEGDAHTSAEALRRLAVVCHRRQEFEAARALAERSRAVAAGAGSRALVAEALNTLGGFELVEDRYPRANQLFHEALELAPGGSELRGRIEQNLGTIESLQGNRDQAMERYQRSLEAFLAADHEAGCAIAYHNLGVISSERRRWAEADRYFLLSLRAAEQTGDSHLRGLGLLNRAEVLTALGRLREARLSAEAAASLFDELRAAMELADAYRALGVVCRESGELGAAQARLRLSLEVAVAAGSPSSEAEAMRELAVTCALAGQAEKAQDLMLKASRVLGRLKPHLDPEDVLAGGYPPVVRSWGEVIRSAHPLVFAHAQRVAAQVVGVARALGRDRTAQARLQIAAYLHDVGCLRGGGTSPEEMVQLADPDALARQHPVWSAELVSGAGLPWDLEEVIRGHRERCDGTGYPDGLRGLEITIDAQILGIVDRYDNLTCGADGHPGVSPPEALAQLAADRAWWQADVYQAFRGTCAA